MNLTVKTTGNVAEELNQSNESSDANNEGIQDIKAKLRESSKK
jgi:hypothetical protein